jgi:hypothetical protein
MSEPIDRESPETLSDDFTRRAKPIFGSQARANDYFKGTRAAILDRQERERSRISFEHQQSLFRLSQQIGETFRPIRIELARVHGHEQRFAAAKSTRAVDRAIFIARHRQRFMRHKLLSPREIGRMTFSPVQFSKALAALHRAERSQIERQEVAIYKKRAEPMDQKYRQETEVTAALAQNELNDAAGRLVRYAPDANEAKTYYQRQFEPHLGSSEAAPRQPRSTSKPIHAFAAVRGNSSNVFQKRAEQIRVDMQNWLAQNPQRERDDGRER